MLSFISILKSLDVLNEVFYFRQGPSSVCCVARRRPDHFPLARRACVLARFSNGDTGCHELCRSVKSFVHKLIAETSFFRYTKGLSVCIAPRWFVWCSKDRLPVVCRRVLTSTRCWCLQTEAARKFAYPRLRADLEGESHAVVDTRQLLTPSYQRSCLHLHLESRLWNSRR